MFDITGVAAKGWHDRSSPSGHGRPNLVIPDRSAPSARRFAGPGRCGDRRRRRIGSAISERFVAEGAIVAVCDADAAAAEVVAARPQDGGGRAGPVFFDVADAMPALPVSMLVGRHGRLDVLVNNAGINRRGDLLAVARPIGTSASR